jgi:hypothetical protein
MPEVGRDVAFYLNLYRQCSTWNILPESGGLFDQRWEIMDILNIIGAEVDRWKQKRMADERADVEKQTMLRGMNGGR